MASRVTKPPCNMAVHSGVQTFVGPDQSNSRTMIADVAFLRHRMMVFWDEAEKTYCFERFEHGRQTERRKSLNTENALLEKMASVMEQLGKAYLHERRFSRGRGVDSTYIEDKVPGVRTFDRTKVPQRSLLDRYQPFRLPPHQDD